MEWLYFALLSAMLFGITNIFDKFLLSRIKSPVSYIIMLAIIASLFAFILSFIAKIQYSYPHSVLGVLSGILGASALIYYAKAVSVEEVSRVIPLLFTSPLITILLSMIFLKETLTFLQYLGAILLILAAIVISYKKLRREVSITPAVKLLIPTILIFGLLGVLNKFVLSTIDYLSLYVWVAIGNLLLVIFLLFFRNLRQNLLYVVNEMTKKRLWKVIVLVEITAFFGFIFSLKAISLERVSLVAPIYTLQSFFAFIFALLITKYNQRIIKEEINKGTLISKFTAIILILVGTWMLIT